MVSKKNFSFKFRNVEGIRYEVYFVKPNEAYYGDIHGMCDDPEEKKSTKNQKITKKIKKSQKKSKNHKKIKKSQKNKKITKKIKKSQKNQKITKK